MILEPNNTGTSDATLEGQGGEDASRVTIAPDCLGASLPVSKMHEKEEDLERGVKCAGAAHGTRVGDKVAKKPCIVISARVHPGETNASWIMKGCIEYLVGDSEGARRLRSQYVLKIVPMLNPDGVIVGNYRTGLAGCDLNRKWKQPSKTLTPTIYHMKQMMESMRDERGIDFAIQSNYLITDLHLNFLHT
jgi:murein tripeptide amidase MpaA